MKTRQDDMQKSKAFFGIIFIIIVGCSKVGKQNNNSESPSQISGDPNYFDTTSEISSEEGFNKFWEKFRNFAIVKDYNELSGLTQFPLVIQGPIDSMIAEIDTSGFNFALNLYFQQWDGMSLTNQNTEYNNLLNNEFVIEYFSSKFARKGNLLFEKVEGNWKLVVLYFDTQTFNIIVSIDK